MGSLKAGSSDPGPAAAPQQTETHHLLISHRQNYHIKGQDPILSFALLFVDFTTELFHKFINMACILARAVYVLLLSSVCSYLPNKLPSTGQVVH